MHREIYSSGSPWEPRVGYARAVRAGELIAVAGTTASDEEGNTVGAGDAYRQTRFILEKIDRALRALGGSTSDVIRTRMYVTDITRWEEIGRAHREVFGEIMPAATMVEVRRLVSPEMLVEIEVDAVAGAGEGRRG
jgi:enamine deaminase RidA (YjgF/YER057c/UK114 family)